MIKIGLANIKNIALKTLALAFVCLIIFISISIISKILVEDKKSKAEINEGKYILNKMAEEYEMYLRQKEKNLEDEREGLINKRLKTLTAAERKKIDIKLKEIEYARSKLYIEYQKHEKQRIDLETNLKNTKENLAMSGKEITRLNQKYTTLVYEKESIEKYWANYVDSIKNAIKEIYKTNIKKRNDIDKGFENNNGKNTIINEFKDFNKIINSRNMKVEEVAKEKNEIIRKKDEEIKKIMQQLDKNSNDYSSLKGQLNKSETNSQFYINFYDQYTKLINKFEKMINTYNNAEKLYNEKKYSNAGDEYQKVLNEFNEINQSYKKIKNIEKIIQNKMALDLFNKATDNLSKRKYNEAYTQFSRLIKEYPNSDYIINALSELLKIANSLSDKDRVEIADQNAKKLYDNANNLLNLKDYDKALNTYYQIIMDYPYSNYTKYALSGSMDILKILKQQDRDKYEEELKLKFDQYYKNYVKYNKKGDIEKARRYYYEALSKAFDIYANNSVNEFKKIEDSYIESLIKNNEEEIKKRYKIEE